MSREPDAQVQVQGSFIRLLALLVLVLVLDVMLGWFLPAKHTVVIHLERGDAEVGADD